MSGGGVLGGIFGAGAGAVPGAETGIAIGALLSAGLGALGIGGVDAFKKEAIPAVAQALSAQGMDAELAQEFAERFGGDDNFGGNFSHLADRLGLSTQDLMDELVAGNPEYRSWFLEQTSESLEFEIAPDGTKVAEDSQAYRRFMYTLDAVSPSQAGEEGAPHRFKRAWMFDGRNL